MRFTAIATTALLASAVSVAAQQSPPDTRTRVAEAVRNDAAPARIDGRLDEAIWESAPRAGSFVQFRPSPGAPATQATDVQIAYDDEALYIAACNRDTSADSIVTRLARRDENAQSEWFTVLVDSYHDRRTAFAFAVNPAGVKRDYTIVDDTREDDGWDAVWDAAARIGAD